MKTKYIIWIIAAVLLIACASADLNTDFAHAWKFEEGSGNAVDVVGSEDGTPAGVSYEATGIDGDCYSYDGANDVVAMPTSDLLDGISALTICVWAYNHNAGADWQTIVHFQDGGNTGHLTRGVDDYLVRVPTSGGEVGSTSAGGTSSAGAWHFHCSRWDGSTLNFFLDGSKDSNSWSGSGTISQDTVMRVGAAESALNNDWYGYIDELYIWERALSDTEINTELYAGGSGLFCSGDPCTFSAGPDPADRLNVSSILPINDSKFTNGSIEINATINNTYSTNCSLYINGTYNASIILSPGQENLAYFNINFNDGGHYFNITCANNETSQGTETSTIWIDSINPIVTYSSIEGTTYWTNTQELTIIMEDQNLYSMDINDTCGLDNFSDGLNSPYNYTISQDLTSCTLGAKETYIMVCDAHTLQSIGSYDVDQRGNAITFDYTTITSLTEEASTDYRKKEDRYSFTFSYDTPKTQIQLRIPPACKAVKNSPYKGHFVCYQDGRKWIDFEGPYSVEIDGNVATVTSEKPLYDFEFNSIGTLNCIMEGYTWYNMGRLNITAIDRSSNAIDGFTIYRNGTVIGTASNGFVHVDNLTVGSYNITIAHPLYETKSAILNVTSTDTYQFHQFQLFDSNSISINIYDEATSALITDNVSITYTSDYGEFTNHTTSGHDYVANLTAAEYSIQFEAAGYSIRTYVITITNNTHSNLNAYLSGTNTTIFVFQDKDTGEYLENVLLSMYRNINGTPAVVESKYTDITGRTEISYSPDVKYSFLCTKTGYENLYFELDPISFDSYDIQMEKSVSVNSSIDYDKISIVYSPKSFNNNENTTFTFIIQSPYGELLSYGFTATFPGGTASASGSNAIGEYLSETINISGADSFDRVRLDYSYSTGLAGERNFTVYLPIDSPYAGTNTFLKNKDEHYGLGIFERILVASLIVLAVVGVATLSGRPVEGMALGLVVFGMMAYAGFIPLWSILISMLLGVMFISWMSGG